MNTYDNTSEDILDSMIERAIAEVVDEARGEAVTAEQLTARAQMRFAELSRPYRQGIDAYVAEIVSETLIDVAERAVRSEGAEKFSPGRVVDESMAKIERVLGKPEDPDQARTAIRAYLDDAHGAPRAEPDTN